MNMQSAFHLIVLRAETPLLVFQEKLK